MMLVGQRFGRLVVVEQFPREGRPDGVLIRCDCGAEKETCSRSVRRGRTRSCGCLQPEHATTHGLSSHPEYTRWRGMLDRCYRPDSPSYPNYGARGIGVCDEWKSNPAAFVRWAEANGGAPDTQIDRIDGDQGYSPSNCRFVSAAENAKNRRVSVSIVVNGESVALVDAVDRFGIPYDVLIQRLRKLRWAPERAVSEPVRVVAKGRRAA